MVEKMLKILVVDDDKNIRDLIKMAFESKYEVDTANSAEKALELIKEKDFDIIISDYNMSKMTGLDLLENINSKNSQIFFILITAYGSSELIIKSMQTGAFEFISKPFKLSDLKSIVENIRQRICELRNCAETQTEDKGISDFSTMMIANSPTYINTLKEMAKIAKSDYTVLLLGETGVGKEVMANLIHNYSLRKDKLFTAINCNAIPENLLESELFGYEKGAFTGADKPKPGLLEITNGGTFFFDEIGDLSLEMQVKLLRVLQENKVRRIGSKSEIDLNIRYIFATNVDLNKKVQENLFRKDLYYRIKVATINIPPLRERKEDIIPLAEYFIKKHSDREVVISNNAKKFLLNYHFPGNIRELENIIRQSLTKIGTSSIIMKEDLVDFIHYENYDKKKRTITKEELLNILAETGYNKSLTAERLNIGRTTLYRILDKYGIKI